MRRRQWVALLPVIPLAVGAVVVGVNLLGDDRDDPEPMAISSSAPVFATLDELVAASDSVVVASVTDIGDGRTITAPGDPESGIRTRLVTLDVSDILAGEAPDPLVVEEAVALTDGTPVVVDGVQPLAEGDVAVWFLVSGHGEAMPYYAVVNRQGRYRVNGDTLVAASEDDPLSRRVAALGLAALVERIG